jgi:hypothetical protein
MDAADAKLLADVKQHGWHMITVSEDDEGPGFTYTIGLFHTYQHPEVIVFGLPNRVMQGVVDCVAGLVKGGAQFADGEQSDRIINSYACIFRTVLQEHYAAHFGYANWFYKPKHFPAVQCVWPDKAGRFPWLYRRALRPRDCLCLTS